LQRQNQGEFVFKLPVVADEAPDDHKKQDGAHEEKVETDISVNFP